VVLLQLCPKDITLMKCENKTAYPTRYKAERAMNLIWKNHWLNNARKKPCATYKCNICGKWHLTSQAQRRETTNSTQN
jgi:hypothetical protein